MVDDKLLAAPETGKAAALADHELDRRIADRAEMIRLALRDHERAVAQQRRCQKSAVLSAWNFEDELREEREQTEDLRERVALQGDLETGKNGAEFQQLNTLQAIRRSLQAGRHEPGEDGARGRRAREPGSLSGKLNARTFQSQQTEIAMQIDALNRSICAAKPNTIRIR